MTLLAALSVCLCSGAIASFSFPPDPATPARLLAHADAQPIRKGFINPCSPPYNASGDGTTDDSVALQQAVDDAYAARMSVFLPPSRVFLLSKQLRFVQTERSRAFGFQLVGGGARGGSNTNASEVSACYIAHHNTCHKSNCHSASAHPDPDAPDGRKGPIGLCPIPTHESHKTRPRVPRDRISTFSFPIKRTLSQTRSQFTLVRPLQPFRGLGLIQIRTQASLLCAKRIVECLVSRRYHVPELARVPCPPHQ
jgi:hypothetical protein